MRKKLISMLLCATMAVTMMTGCGSGDDAKSDTSDKANSASSETKSSDPIKLTLWGAEEDQDLLKDLVGKFESTYSDQKFDISIGVESEGTAKDTILTDIEAAADVFAFASDQIYDLIKAGALANIDETGDALAVGNRTLDDVKSASGDAAIEAASVDGKMYAFPMAGDNSYFLYYDSSKVKDADVADWDKLLAAAAKAKKKVGMTYASGWYLASFFYGAGFTTDLNDDGTTAIDWNGTSKDGISGVDVTKAMIKIASSPAFLPTTDETLSDTIASGKLCAVVSGTWDAAAAKKAFGEKNCKAIKLPTFAVNDKQIQMAPAFGYKFVGVNAYSKESGWATLLADFLTNEESQAERFAKREIGPTNKNVLESDAVKKNIAIAAVTSESEFGVIQKVGGKFWDPTKTFGEMITQGKLSVKDDDAIQKALDSLVQGVTASVK